jgi:hypothetical protein
VDAAIPWVYRIYFPLETTLDKIFHQHTANAALLFTGTNDPYGFRLEDFIKVVNAHGSSKCNRGYSDYNKSQLQRFQCSGFILGFFPDT